MSTYIITLTAEQDAALAILIARTNAARAAQNPPLAAITINQYVQARATEIADSYAAQIRGETEIAVREGFKAADTTKQAQIKTILGL